MSSVVQKYRQVYDKFECHTSFRYYSGTYILFYIPYIKNIYISIPQIFVTRNTLLHHNTFSIRKIQK